MERTGIPAQQGQLVGRLSATYVSQLGCNRTFCESLALSYIASKPRAHPSFTLTLKGVPLQHTLEGTPYSTGRCFYQETTIVALLETGRGTSLKLKTSISLCSVFNRSHARTAFATSSSTQAAESSSSFNRSHATFVLADTFAQDRDIHIRRFQSLARERKLSCCRPIVS